MLSNFLRRKWIGVGLLILSAGILYRVSGSVVRETESLNSLAKEENKYSGQLKDTLKMLEDRFINPALEKGYISTECLEALKRFNAAEEVKGKDTLNHKGYYIITIDSIVRTISPSVVSDPSVYYYTNPGRQDSIFDAVTILTPTGYDTSKRFTHLENTNYLILYRAFQELKFRDTTLSHPLLFNCYIFYNGQPIRKNISYIKTDAGKRYLYQIRFRYSHMEYTLVEKSVIDGFVRKNKWTIRLFSSILLCLLVLEYLLIQTISNKNKELLANNQNLNRYMKTLDKATCAIAIADFRGDIVYENRVFREWSGYGSAKGKNIRAITKLSEAEFDKNWQKLQRQDSEDTVSYISKLGQKTVVTNLSIDSESQSVIAVENDVSMLVNKYDDNLHTLKNYIDGLKTLNQLILIQGTAEINKNVLFYAIKQNVRGLQEALNIYNNTRVTLSSPTLSQYFGEVDMKDLLDRLLDKLKIPAISYNTRIGSAVPMVSILGTYEDVELIFMNLLLNAMQVCNGIKGAGIMVKAIPKDENNILFQVIDNGKPLVNYTNIEDFVGRSTGLGLQCAIRKIKELGGTCTGFAFPDADTKSFEFTLPKY